MLYLGSRYATYFIQFITSLLIAAKLGPDNFAVWGVVLLILNYFRIVNFGVSNALNIFAIQNKDDTATVKEVTASSITILFCVSLLIVGVGAFQYAIGFDYIEKYALGNLFYLACIAAILTHFNTLFMNIYRIKNRLFEIALYQSVIPFIVFIVTLFAPLNNLLYLLTLSYVIGNLVALFVFISNGKIPFGAWPNLSWVKRILDKGLFLFIYNVCFYLVLLSIRTFISIEYSVTEFGFFSFSFALANAILLFLQALTFIVFPKVIDKFNTTDKEYVSTLISNIRDSYVSFSFGLVFLAIIFFPVLIYFLPQYSDALMSLQLIALTIIMYTQSFGYNTYLMAQNKERRIALMSFMTLFLNIAIASTLIYVFKVNYSYVIFATLVSYFFYAFSAMHYAKKELEIKHSFKNNCIDIFPLRLCIPYVLAILIVVSKVTYALPLPLVIFLIMNKRNLAGVYNRLKSLFVKPDIINLD